MGQKMAKAGPRADAETGPQIAACLAACGDLNTSDHKARQDSMLTAAPSRQATMAVRDMAYEAIVETAALIESYSRSLGEAAWRADGVTVEVHLRQLRACVIAAIGVYKSRNGVDAEGGGA